MRRALLILVAAGVLAGGTAAQAAAAGAGLAAPKHEVRRRATRLRGDEAAGAGLAAPKHEVRRRATRLRGDEVTVDGQPQTRPAPPRPAAARPPAPRRGFGVFVTFDRVSLDASRTFDAVLGKSRLTSVGVAAEATNIVSRVFARVAFSRTSADGERVFIIDGQPVPIGIPIEVEMTPIEIAGGWRQPFGRRGRVAGYGGAGALTFGYREASEFGTPADDSEERFTGYLVFGGVDVDLFKGLTAGFEAQYRSVADALGDGGVSRAFGETNLGGVVVRVLVGFRR